MMNEKANDFQDHENDTEYELCRDQIKPEKLKKGNKVALISPGSRIESPRFLRKCIQIVEEMGFVPVVGKSVLKYDGFTAGTDEERLEDIRNLLLNPEISAMFVLCTGWGSLRLLPHIDFSEIRNNPKVWLGSGDADALLAAINELTGLVVLHAANLAEITDQNTFDNYRAFLLDEGKKNTILCRVPGSPPFSGASYSLNSKLCRGKSCGGNLTAITSLLGTRYKPDLRNKILILDDYGERNCMLDRWFTSLYLAGDLEKVAGIAFGQFFNCGPKGADNMLSIEDTFGYRLAQSKTPSCFGFKFASNVNDHIVSIGTEIELDCDKGKLEFLETAFS